MIISNDMLVIWPTSTEKLEQCVQMVDLTGKKNMAFSFIIMKSRAYNPLCSLIALLSQQD